MRKVPNINCTYYDSFGKCNHKYNKQFFKLFRSTCLIVDNGMRRCDLQIKYKKPDFMPPPPPPKRYPRRT